MRCQGVIQYNYLINDDIYSIFYITGEDAYACWKKGTEISTLGLASVYCLRLYFYCIELSHGRCVDADRQLVFPGGLFSIPDSAAGEVKIMIPIIQVQEPVENRGLLCNRVSGGNRGAAGYDPEAGK